METLCKVEQVLGGVPIKMWTQGVPVEAGAREQLANAARLPIVFKYIAAMPDVHVGIGATVGSVIPTVKAIIPAAVGVDIGCGMIAAKTGLRAEDLPLNLGPLRSAIERAIPHGRGSGKRDPGAWNDVPDDVDKAWVIIEPGFRELCNDYPNLKNTNNRTHLGTMGSGNHYGEVCLDEEGYVWLPSCAMLPSAPTPSRMAARRIASRTHPGSATFMWTRWFTSRSASSPRPASALALASRLRISSGTDSNSPISIFCMLRVARVQHASSVSISVASETSCSLDELTPARSW